MGVRRLLEDAATRKFAAVPEKSVWGRPKTDLVGGLEHFLFFHILGTIIPTDSYFSERLKPPKKDDAQIHNDTII